MYIVSWYSFSFSVYCVHVHHTPPEVCSCVYDQELRTGGVFCGGQSCITPGTPHTPASKRVKWNDPET